MFLGFGLGRADPMFDIHVMYLNNLLDFLIESVDISVVEKQASYYCFIHLKPTKIGVFNKREF